MPSDSQQHALDRVRRPRVQISYDVETNGATQQVELPFVVGVLADLSGQPKDPPKPLKERAFVGVDKDNFDAVLAKAAPRLAFRADDELSGDGGQLNVELNFRGIDDFEPARVAEQVAPLKELLDVRQKLTQLLTKLEGNDKLESLLAEVLSDTEAARKLAGQLGVAPPAPTAPQTEDSK